MLTDARADGLAAAVAEVGTSAVGFVCDVGTEASVEGAVAEAVAALGGLDTLATCAGIVRSSATHECSLEDWETMLRINLTGTFLAVKHSVPT